MPSLAEIQVEFAERLREPNAPAPTAVRSPPGSSPGRRFNVYRNNMAVSLIDALRTAFPAVHRLVGNEFFRAAAGAYVKAEPPASPVLLTYGETFGDFLNSLPSAAGVPYLADVARLEWSRLNAFHARDIKPLGIDALAVVPPDVAGYVTVGLHPSLALVRSQWPIVSLWCASTQPEADIDVEMTRPEDAVVLRPCLDVDTRILPEGGYPFIDRLRRGEPLQSAAQRACDESAVFDLSVHLRGLFDMGAVISVHTRPKRTTT